MRVETLLPGWLWGSRVGQMIVEEGRNKRCYTDKDWCSVLAQRVRDHKTACLTSNFQKPHKVISTAGSQSWPVQSSSYPFIEGRVVVEVQRSANIMLKASGCPSEPQLVYL